MRLIKWLIRFPGLLIALPFALIDWAWSVELFYKDYWKSYWQGWKI